MYLGIMRPQIRALQVLLEFYEGMQRAKRNFSDRFSGQQFSDYDSELHMSSWGSLYSAVPLCTSCLAHQYCVVISILSTNLPAWLYQ